MVPALATPTAPALVVPGTCLGYPHDTGPHCPHYTCPYSPHGTCPSQSSLTPKGTRRGARGPGVRRVRATRCCGLLRALRGGPLRGVSRDHAHPEHGRTSAHALFSGEIPPPLRAWAHTGPKYKDCLNEISTCKHYLHLEAERYRLIPSELHSPAWGTKCLKLAWDHFCSSERVNVGQAV